MKSKVEIEIEIACIENEINKISKLQPIPTHHSLTEYWIETMNSAIRALKWVLDETATNYGDER